MSRKASQPISFVIHQCSLNHRPSQKQLYKIIGPRMYALCLNYCVDRADAEAVFEAGFIRVLNTIASYSFSEDFYEWCKLIFIKTSFEYYQSLNTNSKSVGQLNLSGDTSVTVSSASDI